MRKLLVSGPVIIHEGKIVLTKDSDDPFYKLPGGRVREGESIEDACRREFKEETGMKCEIVKELSTEKLDRNPKTGEEMEIELHNFLCNLVDPPEEIYDFEYDGQEVKWFDLDDIEKWKELVSPNTKFLIKQGDIK